MLFILTLFKKESWKNYRFYQNNKQHNFNIDNNKNCF